MKHTLHETAPLIVTVLTLALTVAVIAISSILLFRYTAGLFNDPHKSMSHSHLIAYTILTATVMVLAFLFIPFMEFCIVKKPLFRDGDIDYATKYAITTSYVLPHTDNIERNEALNRCNFNYRCSFTRNAIARALDIMKQHHQVYYNFPLQNLPGTTVQVQMGISRHSAEQLLAKMSDQHFVVLETTLTTEYDDCRTPKNQYFISKHHINALKKRLDQSGKDTVTVALNIHDTVKLNQRYLDFCQALITSCDELINLPPCRGTGFDFSINSET